ncbi:Crp/Fnr family transcriptional regulator [Pontibacter sp. G13]|uniref:Crp/Fnr family transcriptional regulator n=1 Tax=Pontibacter sp. G13 TaxID=3074898 RepID=UPI00288A8F9C|nr:Crp/Fnr family transcriptional regulator [Pontibacter sp. G13]WNJ20312.1 Crp/Fnr family transcriptional regulator [Pontibacter sp. G13]
MNPLSPLPESHWTQVLLDFFERFQPLTDTEREALRAESDIRILPKGTLLLKEGQACQTCFFVLKGCVRQYQLQDGEEITSAFFLEEEVVALLGPPGEVPVSNCYWECTEDCVLAAGTPEQETDMYARFPKFESISRQIVEIGFGRQQAWQASFLTQSPEQRYLQLLDTRPELVQRVPQYQLASYIGVKPESLSRIRKRMNDRNKSSAR